MPAPANRSETAPAPEDAPASEAAPAANAAPAAGGGAKAWLPLIVMTVLMPALAYAMTAFVMVPKLQKGLGVSSSAPAGEAASGKSKKEAPGAKTESIPVNKLLVNVAGTMGARYLLVSLSVVGSGADFKAQMDAHDAQLRDMAQSALATKTLADLEKPGARNMIRNELLSGFNNILGDGTVQEIYFPEFAIQ
ncbi:MAG TPA: flagellar basal body-associated FliL family protein [Verrucomicrobiae bacterium]|jgi:flagellar FliL protein|nr:flagellar basal body-associated FliL family protein [Verrucomicrobiae bacterium]